MRLDMKGVLIGIGVSGLSNSDRRTGNVDSQHDGFSAVFLWTLYTIPNYRHIIRRVNIFPYQT
jgi:hypothetical protein